MADQGILRPDLLNLLPVEEDATDNLVAVYDTSLSKMFAVPLSRIASGGAGSGTVNTGTANRIAYYPSTGTAVDDLSYVTTSGTTLSVAGTVAATTLTGDGSGVTALNATQLTSGTVPDARFPSTLPALNGSALTNLNGSAIASGTVPAANLGSGTSITTKYLRGDNTWQTISGGGDALTSGNLGQFAATTSAQLAGVISDETGTGALVFANSPTLVTPALGTPASGNLSNCTAINGTQITSGTVPAAQLGSGTSITTKFLRGDNTWQTISGGGDALTTSGLNQFAATTSAQLAGVISDETGSGALVFGTAPTLTAATLAGALSCADNEVGRPKFKDYAETVNALGNTTTTMTCDYTLGNVVTATLTGNVGTVTLSNPPGTGIAGSLTILLTQDATGSRTVTWPASVKWGAAGAPTLTTTASKTDIITLITLDAGTTWRGSYALGFD